MRMLNGDPRVLLSNDNDYDLKEGEVSSGTTIMAIACGNSVILGADSRVSTGAYVANRVSDKIAQLSEHIYCCRSGSAADTQFLTDVVKHFLQQLRCVHAAPRVALSWMLFLFGGIFITFPKILSINTNV